MINNLYAVGRLVRDPEIRETDNGKTVANITIAIPRSYKNAEGEYDTDFLDCTLWAGVAQNTHEYCKKGDLIGVRGRVESSKDENGYNSMRIVAERITFLAAEKKHGDKIIDDAR